jgi:oligopeptide/dipeptide ABC transporter ATP-binding protein
VTGETPSPIAPPPGCVFHPRCPIAVDVCHMAVPASLDLGRGHLAACVKADTAEQAFA